MKSFVCSGTVTLTQRPSVTPGQPDQLSGFAVVSRPCPPISFDLEGSVSADGSIRFVSGGAEAAGRAVPGGIDGELLGGSVRPPAERARQCDRGMP
jgi:hypothetical protein